MPNLSQSLISHVSNTTKVHLEVEKRLNSLDARRKQSRHSLQHGANAKDVARELEEVRNKDKKFCNLESQSGTLMGMVRYLERRNQKDGR